MVQWFHGSISKCSAAAPVFLLRATRHFVLFSREFKICAEVVVHRMFAVFLNRWIFFIAVSSLDTSSSFEDQFRDLTSFITFFEQCSQDTQGFIDLMRQQLSDSIKADLITDAEKQRLSSYSAKKSTLLVVGQTNSGKSSFVNELLGGSFMPTSEVPCTSRIVRLKYSEENYYQVLLTEFLKQSTVTAWNFFTPFLWTPRPRSKQKGTSNSFCNTLKHP